MCGIAGVIDLHRRAIPALGRRLAVANDLLRHRGPDGEGTWCHPAGFLGLGHRRLAVIDLSTGDQPMTDGSGNWISYNGEIYNYRELREELGESTFRTASDTEVILRAYARWGEDALQRLRGMFAFLLWDETTGTLLAARDHFGMKPLYWAQVGDTVYLASEIKALLPFLDAVDTDRDGLRDYLAFQLCLGGKTLFEGVNELLPGHLLRIRNGSIEVSRYWEVYYDLDWDHTSRYFEDRLRTLLDESVGVHLRSDVPVGAYLSGGLDSSVVASVAARLSPASMKSYTGRFDLGREYDESEYARAVAESAGMEHLLVDITVADFIENIQRVIYHLDHPVAGPGAFSQFMVARLVSGHGKVVLGGQGGDEIFGGYTRYLLAYFEQCIKAAIDGTAGNGQFIVSYESIIPNLTALRTYKPLMQEFWREGLFGEMDERYFRLINRSPHVREEVRWDRLGSYSPLETFQSVFNAPNVSSQSYFDRMTHFDFKTLLPALLHVEDRMSMAHGVESRLPFLDRPVVELLATAPADVKFRDGELKRLLRASLGGILPPAVRDRQDKMGFPTPVNDWFAGEARDFVVDVMTSQRALQRDILDNRRALEWMGTEGKAGRAFWGLFSLELWQQEFHDKANSYRTRLTA